LLEVLAAELSVVVDDIAAPLHQPKISDMLINVILPSLNHWFALLCTSLIPRRAYIISSEFWGWNYRWRYTIVSHGFLAEFDGSKLIRWYNILSNWSATTGR
jgi:hypothetical protein